MEQPVSRPVIVHIIDDLGRGGAEILLVDLLPELSKYYDIVLVTLTGYNEFPEGSINVAARYSLDFKGKFDIFRTARQLKKIIRKHQPVLVRSQLFWSSLVARIACPANVPLIFSIHTKLSVASFSRSIVGRLQQRIEKFFYKKRHAIIGVSAEAIADYDQSIGIKGKSFVLHNYVNDSYFSQAYQYHYQPGNELKFVAVGNPKREKNYEFLAEVFGTLKDQKLSCDIYGAGYGDYDQQLQKVIDSNGAAITLKGKSSDVAAKLKDYNAFIMPSSVEGFGIAAAEAMAVGLPLFLSDIRVFHEVSHDNAIFFDLENKHSLSNEIKKFKEGQYDGGQMGKKGKEIAITNYSKQGYLQKLLDIYQTVIRDYY